MIIQYTNKRKKFEKLIRKLGYIDRSPIINPRYKKVRVLKEINLPQNVEIYISTKHFINKKSYLWHRYCHLIEELNKDKKIKKEDIKIGIRETIVGILYKEDKKNQVCELEWEIKYWYRFFKLNKNDMYKFYLIVLRNFKPILKNGTSYLKPINGGILVSHPSGMRIFKNDFLEKKTSQREKINMRFFNFSKINSCGDQYAVYDENFNLHPTI
jgi:hypothetical protein